MTVPRADAIVVGARCAGSAAAIALARAGRRVVAFDRARFPSDTLSTHLLFAGGVAELRRLGVLERVEALGPPRMPAAEMHAFGRTASGGYTPVDGVDYALCVRRSGLDAVLVEAAREAGADVRERTGVTDLVRESGEGAYFTEGVRAGRGSAGRVIGVRTADGDEIHAPLVIGADGRRSTVARLVGATEPYRSNPNGRACFFAYFSEGRPSRRTIAAQWREGRELGTAFPCDGGLILVLLMPPVERAPAFRDDPGGEYDRTIERMPGLRERLRGGARTTKVRGASDLPSYFRRSSGPGWALAGDAGHFKDPVTAQGIRDALRFGRLLGERVAPVLDSREEVDATVSAWERDRDRKCLETYQWTNLLARGDGLTALDDELYRAFSRTAGLAGDVLDVFSRVRKPSQALTMRRSLGFGARAVARTRGRALPVVLREARLDARSRAERLAARTASTKGREG